MEDVPVAQAFRGATFSVDLDYALESLKGAYSNKAHVVARLKKSPLFTPGKDFVFLKPDSIKRKYFLTESCLQKLLSSSGKIVKHGVSKRSAKRAGQMLESLSKRQQHLAEAVKQASTAGVQQQSIIVEEHFRECGNSEQELEGGLVQLLKQGGDHHKHLSASVAQAKEDARILQEKLKQKNEQLKQKNEQLRKLWKERDKLRDDMKQLRVLAGSALDTFDKGKRGMWTRRSLQCGQEFTWPTAAVAAKLDAAVRKEEGSETVVCKTRKYRLVESEHRAIKVRSGGENEEVSLGAGLVTCEALNEGDVLFFFDGRWFFGEAEIVNSLGPMVLADGQANQEWRYCLELVGSGLPTGHGIVIDGRPEQYGNIAGYVNSCVNVPGATANVAYRPFSGKHPLNGHARFVVMLAIRDIAPGEELFASYDPFC
eukprot:TRINITY_DN301_c0_g1_i1.p1 TRINITY_DN301_c0_g1~~TRINITY_DN301_c0_g1_i1.p1  ORF type:complete len:427 (+),score=83.09 TRINITY_DN301_c0_g1_i1:92-1372(+)